LRPAVLAVFDNGGATGGRPSRLASCSAPARFCTGLGKRLPGNRGGIPMRIARTAALAVMMFGAATAGAGFSDAAYAAAPADIDPGADESAAIYQLDTVLVVHNWVLCTSRDSAERLARAREAGTVVAQQAYAELAAAKTCGKFKKLGVMLHAPLYRSAPGN